MPMMKGSIIKGLGFGLTSGIITTLGLIVGLHSGTHSRSVVVGGVLVIAIADALSDSLGIHISEESGGHGTSHIWASTLTTLASKFIFAVSFLVPLLLLELDTAIVVSIAWGLSLIMAFSFYIAKRQGEKPWKAVAEHVLIAIAVIILTHYVGDWLSA